MRAEAQTAEYQSALAAFRQQQSSVGFRALRAHDPEVRSRLVGKLQAGFQRREQFPSQTLPDRHRRTSISLDPAAPPDLWLASGFSEWTADGYPRWVAEGRGEQWLAENTARAAAERERRAAARLADIERRKDANLARRIELDEQLYAREERRRQAREMEEALARAERDRVEKFQVLEAERAAWKARRQAAESGYKSVPLAELLELLEGKYDRDDATVTRQYYESVAKQRKEAAVEELDRRIAVAAAAKQAESPQHCQRRPKRRPRRRGGREHKLAELARASSKPPRAQGDMIATVEFLGSAPRKGKNSFSVPTPCSVALATTETDLLVGAGRRQGQPRARGSSMSLCVTDGISSHGWASSSPPSETSPSIFQESLAEKRRTRALARESAMRARDATAAVGAKDVESAAVRSTLRLRSSVSLVPQRDRCLDASQIQNGPSRRALGLQDS